MDWKDAHWKDLLDAPGRGRTVVPVVGVEMLNIEVAGRVLPFPQLLAERLADLLPGDERARLSATPTLHEVALAPRWRGREAEFAAEFDAIQDAALEEVLPRVLDPAFPSGLRLLAEITDFPLYLTTTPDALLERVLAKVRGLAPADVRAFHLHPQPAGPDAAARENPCDLPRGWQPGPRPLLFYLFGRANTEGQFDLTEEHRLETLWRLQSEDYQPEQLMRELQHGHLLLLGTRLPEWFGRHFIRLLRGHRLAEMGGSTEAFIDSLVSTPGPPAPLVAFLDTFSQSTRLYRSGDPAHFVTDLHRRWTARHAPTPAPVACAPPAALPAPARDLAGDGFFISYRREDAVIAVALHRALEDAGLPVWLDVQELHTGERYADKIQRNIENAAFFIPLLSAHTCGQGGFFRREWAWACAKNADFTGMDTRTYLRPIIVDDTPHPAFTDLPADFTAAHIVICPGGEVTPAFLAELRAAHERWAAKTP